MTATASPVSTSPEATMKRLNLIILVPAVWCAVCAIVLIARAV